MNRWDDILSNISGGVGAGSSLMSRTFDLLNGSGATKGTSSVALVRDINTNGFLANKSIYKPDYFIRAFDEPTYLTFKLEFIFNNKRNALYNNELKEHVSVFGTSYNYDGDTEQAYDFLPEAFLQDGMLTNMDNFHTELSNDNAGIPESISQGGTINNAVSNAGMYSWMTPEVYNVLNNTVNNLTNPNYISYYYSAEDYLGLNRGEYGRAKLMRKIKMILRDLQENFPYYFKSIEGLDKLNSINAKSGFRVGEDVVLSIKCYEGIDLKITQLIQMIRKVTWDDMYQRWVLPDIMRYFAMNIYVSEIRTFHEMHSGNLIDAFRRIPKLTLYDFKNDTSGELRNMTEAKPGNDIYRTIMGMAGGILTAAQALGDTFFDGTLLDDIITTTNNTFTGASDVTSSLAQIYQTMCVSAINEVMPTICYECHMCEFDISDTMSEMGTMHSTSGDPQEQTLRIKVHQVEDYQVYPLDRNLTVNNAGTGYTLNNRMYGVNLDGYNEDISDASYNTLRSDGYTGSTFFTDRTFNETFNGTMRNIYDKAKEKGNGINQTALYRSMATVYDEEVKNSFINRAFSIFSPNETIGISPRSKMYPGKLANNLMHSTNGALRYKRNSLDVISDVLTLLIGGLNAADQIGNNAESLNGLRTFSKATSLTIEDLQTALPDIYAATRVLQSNIEKMKDDYFSDTDLGAYELLNNLAFSQATKYTPIGAVSSVILGSMSHRPIP